MLFNEFKEKIEAAYHAEFPDSYCKCYIFKCLGDSIVIDAALAKDQTECTSGIIENDPAHNSFMAFLPKGWDKTEALPDITLEKQNSAIRVKPELKYMYCSYKKVSYRKVTGNPEKIIKAFEKWVKALKQAFEAEYNTDNLLPQDKALYATKRTTA